MAAFDGTPFAKGTTVAYGTEHGTIIAVGRNGWYMVEFQTHGTTTRLSLHHSQLEPVA